MTIGIAINHDARVTATSNLILSSVGGTAGRLLASRDMFASSKRGKIARILSTEKKRDVTQSRPP